MLWAHQCQKNRLKSLSPVLHPSLPPRRGLGHDMTILIDVRNPEIHVPRAIKKILKSIVMVNNYICNGTGIFLLQKITIRW